MKKLLAFIMVAWVCVSCYDSKTHKDDSDKTITKNVPYVYTEQIMLESESYTYGQISSIRHFTYKGHDYIQFHVCGTHGGGNGIVHDPDCQCTKKEK